MASRWLTLVLAVALAGSLLLLLPQLTLARLPGIQAGYEPDQPIAFSHRLHAGELGIDCLYCHFAAEKSRHAGIPAASTCMKCHRFVTATLAALRAEDAKAKKEGRPPGQVVSPELEKLYRALGLDRELKPLPRQKPQLIAWVRVHNLPDFVYFDHRPHVAAGVACQSCHGPVETMERLRQVSDLTMGFCLNCHRQNQGKTMAGRVLTPRTECSACHF
jgi:hypothetical protein